MTTMESTAEARWIDAVGQFVCVSEAMQTQLDALTRRTQDLQQQLHEDVTALPRNGRLLEQGVQHLETALATAIQEATKTWGEEALGRQFSESMVDRLVLLIYGKVNAGKSTLLNFLVERFAAHGVPAQRFRLENGQEVALEHPFETSCTENTAHVQGVKLGANLVVLDTPGLLSVTPDNHALTNRFKVAADGALLLTNSAAPGQTQELQLLRAATESGKPIQIVLTQSDVNEPVIEDGELLDRWVNKDQARRRGQEHDVLTRAHQMLKDETQADGLWAPVSLSVKCALEAGCTAPALQESGVERLYQQLSDLAQRALDYKRKKPLNIYQQYLNNVFYPTLHDRVLPPLDALRTVGQQAITQLRGQTPVIYEQVMAEMVGELPAVLRRHQDRQDVRAVARDLSVLLEKTSNRHLRVALADYETQAEAILIDLDPARFGSYSERFIDVEQQRGAGWMAAAGAGGTALGTAVGTAAGPAGMLVGGLIGSLVGTALGRLATSETTIRVPVGTDYAELQTRIEASLQTSILSVTEKQISSVCSGLETLDTRLCRLVSLIERFRAPTDSALVTHRNGVLT